MRVRITYSVDMDEVPTEVSCMLDRNVQQLAEVLEMIEDSIGSLRTDRKADFKSLANSLDKARQKLSNFDYVLADAYAVLHGFADALDAPPAEEDPPSSDETDV